MKTSHLLPVSALAVALTVGALAPTDDPRTIEGQAAIVLELYTSQGCYSCPPADRLLKRLGQEASAHGHLLVPLAFHVDYWNYIGWTDPFSSKAWTVRQRRYARTLRQDTIYTPQLVVDGWRQCVGADERSVRREIERAAAVGSSGRIDLEVTPKGDRAIEVRLSARLERRIDPKALEALVVVFESGLVTEVPRGENANKTLENEFVVRRLESAFTLAGNAGATGSGSLRIALDREWQPENLGVAAFLQDPDSLRIYGASALRLNG